MIETSLCVTSYNRPLKLREVLRSFFMTNLYDLDKLELIIVDNGSTDRSVTDFIKSYSPACKYRFILNEKNDYPSCLRYSKIQAREIAEGDFFIDCPDDHVFVARLPWIEMCVDRIKTDPTVGCINYYAYPEYRFKKSNNTMDDLNKNTSDFCVSLQKGYADFHIMSRETYESIGSYQHQLGRKAEGEYMERSLALGYFRNLMINPVAICMNDGKFGGGKNGFELVRPIERDEYQSQLIEHMRENHQEKFIFPTGIHEVDGAFNRLLYPIHNEALVKFCLRNGHMRVKK